MSVCHRSATDLQSPICSHRSAVTDLQSPINRRRVCLSLGVQSSSVSEIEFCTLYVVAERWILARILRFMHAKNNYSDTLPVCHRSAVTDLHVSPICMSPICMEDRRVSARLPGMAIGRYPPDAAELIISRA
jgi:hypothetical protein